MKYQSISANNGLPNSSIGNQQIHINSSSSTIRVTPNSTEAALTNNSEIIGRQYDNRLRNNMSAGVKKIGMGALKGLAINLGIDILRAIGNKALASQIEGIKNAMKNEEVAARANITVLAGKD